VEAPVGPASELITREELQLAARNHGMPLEALRYDVTPVGLHYLLIHYDIPFVDPQQWRLVVTGRVRRELSLSLEDVRGRPAVTLPVTMECAGNGRSGLTPRPISQPWIVEAVGTAEWTGTALRPILEEAGLKDDALEVVFTGADRGMEGGVEQDYERSLPLREALGDELLLAYEINGQPLPPQHGFPMRLIVPGWYGMTQVKWLRRITVLAQPFQGYQNVHSYRLRQEEEEPGEPLTRMAPRALMIPPGIPEYVSRSRTVPMGPCTLKGRAWSGRAPIAKVEVSDDGGGTWAEAEVGPPKAHTAWHPWSFRWQPAGPGSYVLSCRATDELGVAQPVEPAWNLGGYANNAVQRVEVTVAAPGG
jgi:DMSO/TMAO reductase YedYZ molybdopterin-dependent catalytic subunit